MVVFDMVVADGGRGVEAVDAIDKGVGKGKTVDDGRVIKILGADQGY